ncbi:MAG: hypothetical protein AAFX02_02755, partial [Pseudomonadota bacterium]
RFKVQGAPGKNRKRTSWYVRIGDWTKDITKADTYSETVSIKDVYKRRKLADRCEQKLAFAASKQGKSKETLRNNGWTDTYTYQLQYFTYMGVDNPLTLRREILSRSDEANQSIVVRCLGFKQTSKPRPNGGAGGSNKAPQTVSIVGDVSLPRDTDAPPPRDTDTARRGPRATTSVKSAESNAGETLKKDSDTEQAIIGKVGIKKTPKTNTKASGGATVKASNIKQNDSTRDAIVSYIVGGFGSNLDGPIAFVRLENISSTSSKRMRVRFTLESRDGEIERLSVLVPPIDSGGVFTAQTNIKHSSESYVSALAELPTTRIKYDLLANDIVE